MLDALNDLLKDLLFGRDPAAALSPYSETGMMLWSALAGALLATLSGAVVQYILARKARKEDLHDRDEANRRSDEAKALNCFIKATIISNHLHVIRKGHDDLLDRANQMSRTNLPLWVRILPVLGLPRIAVEFHVDDLAFLLGRELFDEANDAGRLSMAYVTLIASVEHYNELRTRIMEDLPESSDPDFDPNTLSDETYEKFKVRLGKLNSLSEGNRRTVVDLDNLALTLTLSLSEQFKSEFGNDRFPDALTDDASNTSADDDNDLS